MAAAAAAEGEVMLLQSNVEVRPLNKKKWSKRFIVLFEPNLIMVYKDKPRGKRKVTVECHVGEEDLKVERANGDKNNPYPMLIENKSGRHVISFESESDLTTWTTVLNTMIGGGTAEEALAAASAGGEGSAAGAGGGGSGGGGSGGGDGSAGGGIFGKTIQEGMKSEGRDSAAVLSLVEKCILFVDTVGLESQGIYRLSGSAAIITSFREAFDAGEAVVFDESTDVNAVAGLLKEYLRELPEPVVPYHYYPLFTTAVGYEDTFRASYLRILIENMPKANKTLLIYIIDHLRRVAEHSETNLMKLSNLAVIFGPTLLRMDGETPMQMIQNTGIVCSVVQALIRDYDAIFQQTPSFALLGAAVATYDFAGGEDGELTFSEGDVIFVCDMDQEEWWQGYIDTQCGLFPATYVELVAQFATTFGDVEYEDEELSGDAASGAAADEKPGASSGGSAGASGVGADAGGDSSGIDDPEDADGDLGASDQAGGGFEAAGGGVDADAAPPSSVGELAALVAEEQDKRAALEMLVEMLSSGLTLANDEIKELRAANAALAARLEHVERMVGVDGDGAE